jgi:hypothetical protein
MIAEDLDEFGEYLESALSFWGQSVSEFSLSVWWEAMRPYDLIAVKQAINRHARNPDEGHFAPKPSDLIKMLSGRTVDSAQVAWSKVEWSVRRVGPYQSVVFDDALIHRVLIEMGGWIQLCTYNNDEWPFKANEFQTRYRGYIMRGEIPQYPPVLIGISEASNRNRGYKIEPPTLLGNKDNALLVLKGGNTGPLLEMTRLGHLGFLRLDIDDSVTHEPEVSDQKLRKLPG